MKFNPEEIKEETKKDFDAAWNDGKKFVSYPGINENIRIEPIAQRYITGLNKKIDTRGPVFTTMNMEII
jgi:O-phosphoseryl-tRNA(Cys) synthetase